MIAASAKTEGNMEEGERGMPGMHSHPHPAASASDSLVRPRILRPLPPKTSTSKASKDKRGGGKRSNRVAPVEEQECSRSGLATQADGSFISAKAKEQRAGNGGPGKGPGGNLQEQGIIAELTSKQKEEESMISSVEEDTSLSKSPIRGTAEEVDSWDLCLIVDSDQNTDEAKKEIKKLFKLLKKEGVMLSEPVPLDETGWEGRVLSLATATQAEFEEEAEIMGLSKPLMLNEAVAKRFQMHNDYGRVTAPFTVHKRCNFHRSPFVIKDKVQKFGTEDKSGLMFFSPCERQFLLEHMTENKIRQLIRSKQLSPHTSVTFFPLHETIGEDGKRLQGLKVLEKLRQHWATPWRKERYLSVLKYQSPDLMRALGIWENPAKGTDEPLDDIRSYFGEQIAMYSAFLSFYTRSWQEGFDNMGLVVCCAFICLWSALFIKFWERKQSSLAYYWFTNDLALEEKVRREFYLAMDKLEKGRAAKKKDPAQDTTSAGAHGGNPARSAGVECDVGESDDLQRENEMKAEEFKFPLARRARVAAVSMSVIAVLLSCVVIIFVYMYLINVVAAYTNCEYGTIAGSIVHACLIIGMGWVYRTLAVKLNDRENHRTEVEYENHFILKIFLFEFVNNFLSMIWIAFLSFRYCSQLEEASALLPGTKNKICLLDGIEECEEEFRDNVIMELQTKLGSLFLTRLFVSNIIEAGIVNQIIAKLQQMLLKCCSCFFSKHAAGADERSRHAKPSESSGFWKPAAGMSAEDVGSQKWWIEKGKMEAAWPDYGEGGSARTVDDYNEIVMQFCFVNLFGVAFPITGLLALISNLVEIVVDSRKLCFHTRRPFAQRASSIPDMWMKILKCVALFGVVTNIVIVLTNSSAVTDFLNITEEDGTQLWTAMFVFEHLLVAFIVIFWQITSSEPRRIKKLKVLSRRVQRALLLSSISLHSGQGHGELFHLQSAATSPNGKQS